MAKDDTHVLLERKVKGAGMDNANMHVQWRSCWVAVTLTIPDLVKLVVRSCAFQLLAIELGKVISHPDSLSLSLNACIFRVLTFSF